MTLDPGDPLGPTSLKAVAVDTGAFPTIAREETLPPPKRVVPLRFKIVVATVVLACLGILVAGAVRLVRDRAARVDQAEHAAPAADTQRAAATTAAAPATPPSDTPRAAAATPGPPPAGAPQPSGAGNAPATAGQLATTPAKTSTIRLARGTSGLTVDAKKANGASAVVSCGPHMVSVGKEKPRRVDAPCGRTVIVDVGKTTLAKPSH